MISGKTELGGYVVILKHTPDNLRQIYETVDTDILIILEYIIDKLRVKMTTKTRTFLINS